MITATRGERGWLGEPAAYPGAETLGRMREGELRAAAAILGLIERDLFTGIPDEADVR